MIKLSKRLKAIYDMVPYGVVADVGADHGKLIISLLQGNKISYGYAIENKKGPFSRLESAIKQEKASDKIEALLSDGVKDLPDSVDTVIIAGMGGYNIIDILTEHSDKLHNVKNIIIDAHNAIPFARKEIVKLGFSIADEKIVEEEGIYYEIISFVKSPSSDYGEDDYEYGPILRKEKSEIFIRKYQSRIQEINVLLQRDLPIERINDLKKEKEKLEFII